MAASENAALARAVYERFNTDDLEGALASAAEDVEVVLVPFAATFHGREGFLGFMKSFKDAFPDIVITVTNQIATDDHVVNECTWTGTHTGPLQSPAGEIPATGKAVAGAHFCEVWSIENAQLRRLVNYQDVSSWLRQLGLVE
jgi:steroid delta-isomerase-like uncharacterized protein